MKAVIVELRGSYAAALSSDGSFRRLKNEGYAVGQEVELRPALGPGARLSLRVAGIAAAAAVVAVPAYAYCAPYSYVSLDLVPSIEYSLNRFDRVLDCTAVNPEGSEVLDGLELGGKKIGDAVRLTLEAMSDRGYLSNAAPSGMVIGTCSKNEEKSDLLAETVSQAVKEAAQAEEVELEVVAERVGQERVQEAKKLGTTPGKLNLIEKLQESTRDDAQADTQDWINRPVKEIMEQTRKNETSGKENGSGGGSQPSGTKGPEDRFQEDKRPNPSSQKEKPKPASSGPSHGKKS